jgi:zinc/manganese transport system substrate-binding protein
MNANPRKASACLATLFVLFSAFAAQAKLNVVATLPEYGSIAREIGKDKIDVIVLAKPTDDPHFVNPRPDFVASLRNADILIEAGAGLEEEWLPPLLRKAGNSKLDPGKLGRLDASKGVRLVDLAPGVTRVSSDDHPSGNPHFTVDPLVAKEIAQQIAKTFAAADSANAEFYQTNRKKFETTIDAALQWWRGALQLLSDQHVAAYHDSWPYFAHRFGLNVDIFLEPAPGVPPSASHLADVIQEMKRDHVKAILVEPYQDRRIVETVARATDAKLVEVSQSPGGIPGTDSYTSLINQLVRRFAAALK